MLLSDMQIQAVLGRTGRSWPPTSATACCSVPKKRCYPEDRLRAVSPERLKRYCLRGEGESEGQVLIAGQNSRTRAIRAAQFVQTV